MAGNAASNTERGDQGVVRTARSTHCRLHDVPLRAVTLRFMTTASVGSWSAATTGTDRSCVTEIPSRTGRTPNRPATWRCRP
jgi:hypothetical protein